ncbi:MAG: signal peptidase I [Erysipelotrichaceae bacterium]|nr:signal peptidase I [Erysipelotrichaceae bacterium]
MPINDETCTAYTMQELEEELQREQNKEKVFFSFRNTVSLLIVVAAAVSLLTLYVLPILRINGTSMEPTFNENDMVLVFKNKNLKTGDICAFYYNNTVLVKRVIAVSGDTVDMDLNGNISVNGKTLDEPYLEDRAFGHTDITLPYTVPESSIFVMGDNRSVSIDSRNTVIGCVGQGQIIGKVLFRIWSNGNN